MEKNSNIFISIAAYRDTELIPTLQDMLTHAAAPENLHIAIYWQDDENRDVFTDAGFTFVQQRNVGDNTVCCYAGKQARIDVISVHYYSSRGACWARHQAETLYEGEGYFLQIDSHCRFIAGWDSEMKTVLSQLQLKCDRPVLSGYPPGYEPGPQEENSKKKYISRLIFREFNKEGVPMFFSAVFESTEPVPGSYLAGGFIFSTGSFVRDIPNDPQIFFAGEEIAMAVRAFSQGYSVFHPHKVLLWHFYERKEHNKVWGDHSNQAKADGSVDKAWWERDKISKNRVRTLLGVETGSPADLGIYGLGPVRSLRQFERQAGICLQRRTVLPEVLKPQQIAYFAEPPTDEAAWLLRQINPHRKLLSLSHKEFDTSDNELENLHIRVYSDKNRLLHTLSLLPPELKKLREKNNQQGVQIELLFNTDLITQPAVVRICPWLANAGWGNVMEKGW